MARLTFTDEQKHALRTERFEHPHPRVQLRMEVLWLSIVNMESRG